MSYVPFLSHNYLAPAPRFTLAPRRAVRLTFLTADQVFNPIGQDGAIVKTEGALNSREFFEERMSSIMVAVK